MKSVTLECEILQVAIEKEVSELQANQPNVVAWAKLRGSIQTLTEKVLERKVLVRQRQREKASESLLRFLTINNVSVLPILFFRKSASSDSAQLSA